MTYWLRCCICYLIFMLPPLLFVPSSLLASTSGNVSVSGVLFDSQTGKPVKGATLTLIDVATNQPVALFGDDSVSGAKSVVVTGKQNPDFMGSNSTSSGTFQYSSVKPGLYRFEFVAPVGYVVTTKDAYSPKTLKSNETFNISDASFGLPFSLNSELSQRIDVPLDPTLSVLWIASKVENRKVAPGESVHFDLTIINTANRVNASDVRIFDVLPDGFEYKKGSAQRNNLALPDPSIFKDGKALLFSVGSLMPSEKTAVQFEAIALKEYGNGTFVNVVSALSRDGGTSNISKTIIHVSADHVNSEAVKEIVTAVVIPGSVATVTAAPVELPKEQKLESISPPLSAAASKISEKVLVDESVETNKEIVLPKDNQLPAITSSQVVGAALAGLAGVTEIPVLADTDGQFVKSMAEIQIVKSEAATLVDDTSLAETINVGRGFSRDSLAAGARTEQAKAQTGQAFALLLPSVAFRYNTGMENSRPAVVLDAAGKPLSSDLHSRTDVSLTVRQPLFDLPSFTDWRRRKVVEQARSENYRVSDGDAYVSAVNAYLSLVSTRLQIDMTREFENKLNDLLVYVDKREKAGAASHSDLSRVKARSQATRSSRLEQESAHTAAGVDFVRLTNLVPRKLRIPDIESVGASLLPNTLDMAVSAAMKSNPEIAALSAEVAAAVLEQSSAKSRYLPRVDAEYTDSLSLHAGGDTSSTGQRDQRLMMVFNWSLFNGGSDYNNNIERVARHKELQYRLDDQCRRVVQALSSNYATLTTTRERIASGYQELSSINSAAEAMSKRMLSGNQSLLDLLDVYDRAYQVRSRLVTLHILEMSTVAQLVRLTKGAPARGLQVVSSP